MSDNQDQKVNSRLKQVRKTFKMNQKEFADKLGYKQSSISELENGVKNISKAIIYSLEKELGVNPQWLLDGDGEMFLPKGPRSSSRSDVDSPRYMLTNEPSYAKEPQEPYENIKDKLLEAYEENIKLMKELLQKERELNAHKSKEEKEEGDNDNVRHP